MLKYNMLQEINNIIVISFMIQTNIKQHYNILRLNMLQQFVDVKNRWQTVANGGFV